MDVNLRQVRAFVTVAKLRSFTKAAAVLNIAQPTLTVQIKRLEEALAVRLVDRDSRSVDLTRIGRDLLPVFQRMLQDLDTVVLDARDLSAQRRGIVRIACLPSVAAGSLPDAIRTFRETREGVAFVLKDVIASRVLELVRSEEVDLGVMGGDVSDRDAEILFNASDQMHVVYPADHPVGAAPRITIDAVASYPLILMDPETSVRIVVDAAFMAAGRLPKPVCEATYMMTAVAMVRAGLGLTILPGSAREIQAEPSLRSRIIEGPGLSRSLSIIKKVGRSLPPMSETFARYLAAEFQPPMSLPS